MLDEMLDWFSPAFTLVFLLFKKFVIFLNIFIEALTSFQI